MGKGVVELDLEKVNRYIKEGRESQKRKKENIQTDREWKIKREIEDR